MKVPRRRGLWVYLGVAVVLVMGACGDGGDAEAEVAAAAAQAETAQAQAEAAQQEAEDARERAKEAERMLAEAEQALAEAEDTMVAEVAELRFMAGFTGGDRPVYEAMVAEFNASHPNINVTFDIQPWDVIAQTLPASFAAGEGPDLVTPSFQEGSIFQYAQSDAIMPLTELYESGIDGDAMPPAIFDAFALDGIMYAVPANFASLLLYYNMDFVSQPPSTMEEFRATALEVTQNNADVYGVALAEYATIPMWPILTWADGGALLNAQGCSALGDPATIAAIDPWASLVANNGISPVGETGAGTDGLFAAGRAALQMNGPWAAPGYAAAGVNFGLAPVPAGSAGTVTLASSVPIVVNADTPYQDAAFTFLSWWTSKASQRYLALGSGFPPARTDLADDPAILAHPVVSKFAVEVPNAKILLSGVVRFADVAADVWEPAIARFTRGEPTADVLTNAAAQMDSILGC